MSLSYVNMSSDVYFVCLNHALSTEREEIVGLLVGEVDEKRIAHISAVVILRRSDKRKDRVEISPEQLSNASTEAERLSCILKRPIRIIGWYHSHPKLTVWPSPIDVNTQDSYQMMDDGFLGVIFSVFNDDPSKKGGRVQMTCFQSQTVIEDGGIEKKRLDVPIHIVPASHISNVCVKALIQLPRFLCQEEQLAYQMTNQMELDYLTRLHNSSVYLRSMGQIAEVICGPMIKLLEERILNNEAKRKKLQNKKKEINMVFEQIQMENARSSAAITIKNVKSLSEVASAPCPETETHIETVVETNTVMDNVALDDILLGNVTDSVQIYNSADVIVTEASPLVSNVGEMCISTIVEETIEDVLEGIPSNYILPTTQEINEVNIPSHSNEGITQLESPSDSTKQENQ